MTKTLIYIIGAGRSGTTLLDIMLGNNSNSLSLGEINRFFLREGKPPKREKSSKVSTFWSSFKNQFDLNNQNDYNYLNDLFKNHEYHTSLYKSISQNSDSEYIKLLRLQYDLLYNQTDENVIVESSKYPVRAINLSNYVNKEKFSIKYIYLKKDPANVVNSFQKKNLEQPSKGFFSANIYYLTVNLICNISIALLKKRGHKVSEITYENLTKDTENTLVKIQKDLDLDLTSLIGKINKKEKLKTGFLFDGNRIRLQESITLRHSKKPKKDIKFYFTRILNYIIYR
ncbi:sulfotransferase [Psychroflexus aestuariivivens]|uniref:sulfotransferase n=1 Tax=Psychroflexus aestuariivivens TaxID=1795040 RepID=UPI000FD96B86|nr:sulfotransferase [Psychroflexus aestuariivivens]